MPQGKTARESAGSSGLLARRVTFETFLSKLGAKDRVNVERHVAACEADASDHAKIWKRMACTLATLAPHAVQTAGPQSILFYVADGKYRKQVFTLDDPRDGTILIYCPDVLEGAVKSKLLGGPVVADGEPHAYKIREHPAETLTISSLTGSNTPDPPPSFKHMLGWNRKALRITLTTTSSEKQVAATAAVCALAAEDWQE